MSLPLCLSIYALSPSLSIYNISQCPLIVIFNLVRCTLLELESKLVFVRCLMVGEGGGPGGGGQSDGGTTN